MRTVLICVAAVVILATSGMGQISTTVTDFPTVVNRKFTNLHEKRRPFVGTFEFLAVPEPLTPVKVNFTLEVVEPKHLPEGDWTVRIFHYHKDVRLLTDSLLTWPGSHEPGATLTGMLEFVPLTSGHKWLKLWVPGFSDGELTVQWCFDQDGVLMFLGKAEDKPSFAHPPDCTFFDEDSVHIVQRYEADPQDWKLFSYEISIVPPFRIGDTSTVTYFLTALRDVSIMSGLEINCRNSRIVGWPEAGLPPAVRGETQAVRIRVVPDAIRDIHSLDLIPGSGRSIQCCYMFREDSTLRLIADHGLHRVEDLKTPSLRQSGSGDLHMIKIPSDGGAVKRREL
jgi:hypothetical protein